MIIYAALHEDSQQGWVWLNNPDYPPRAIVKITSLDKKSYVYCEALQIDHNFLTHYNQKPRKHIHNPAESIVMNGWYRAKLGGIETGCETKLSIELANSYFNRLRACLLHPQLIARVAAWLGIISVVLGIVGVALGILSFWPR